MRKIVLTEEQFKQYIRATVKESFVSEKKNATVLSKSKLDAVVSHMADRAKSGDENLLQKARENGINIDSLRGDITPGEYRAQFDERVNKLLDERNSEINLWVKNYLPFLRDIYKHGNENYKKIAVNNKVLDGLSPYNRKNVLLLREFLDKEGLTFLYRDANKPASVLMRYGLEIQSASIDCNTPVDKLNIDFSNISNDEIESYYDGTRIKWINNKLKELGYNVSETEKVEKDSDVYMSGALSNISKAGKLKMVAERYVQRTYGMEFTFGKAKQMFTYGNQKISDDTLIVNFSSALRCPAWNECLLKDACYARTTEKNYDNTLNRNMRTNLIWEQTREDTELTKLMLELIRSYIFNYAKIISLVSRIEKRKVTQDELCSMSLSEIQEKYGEEVIDILKNTLRAKIIRLNEDGDFIGQWLVDTWDKWAEDFKIAGVIVAAYTCRALNYEKVSSMIINVSQEGLIHGQNAPAVAHFFYAVSSDEYNSMGETYGGSKGFNLDVQPNGKIIPVYRKLVEDGEVKGYYYKCPCGRGKFEYKEVDKSQIPSFEVTRLRDVEIVNARADSPKYAECDGKYYELVKVANRGNTVDCYMCRVCYGRDSDEKIMTEDGTPPEKGLPVYILVSAHGQNEEEFNSDRASNLRGMAGKKAKDWITLQTLREQIEGFTPKNDPEAIKQVVKNTVESVANMMRNKTQTASEISESFNRMLDKLNNK